MDVKMQHALTGQLATAALVTALASVGSVPPRSPVGTDADEPPPTFKASALLAPDVLQGPHHRVEEEVRTEGFFHEFTISSTYGSFKAVGRSQLAVRIHEIHALAELDGVSKTEVFLTAAGQSVVKVGQSAAAVVTDPVDSVKGIGAGIKRFGVNLGRRTQRAVQSARSDEAQAGDEQKGQDSAAESAANSVLGVTSAMRRWARKVGVDPYTTNTVLRQALEDIGRVDTAGSIVTKVALPVPAVVGMTSTVGDLVWSKDPEEVRKVNEKQLRELQVPDAIAKTFFTNRAMTLTYQTRLIAALHAVKPRGGADYIPTAAEARTEREALFFVESAEMLQARHAHEPLVGVLTDSRAMVAATRDGRVLLLLPLDWIRWTAANAAAIGDIGARAPRELAAKRLEALVTGRVSDRASRELQALGWTVQVAGS
jgi:hypothetical protein